MRKNNFRVIHVTPYGLSKNAFGALLVGASLCTVIFGVTFAFAAVSFIALLAGMGLWFCFGYYGLYLPKFSITMNMTEKEITIVTPKKHMTVPFSEVSYAVTTTVQVRPTYYLHLFHKGKKLIRINTGNWRNIRFLLDLPHKPDPKIRKLRELREFT